MNGRAALRLLFGASLLAAAGASAQSVANYTPVTRATGIVYSSIAVTGTSFTEWRNGNSTDDNRSQPTDIGFTFHYLGRAYSQFSLSTNGFLDLSSSSASGSANGAYGYQNSQFSAVDGTLLALAPFHDDLVADGNGGTRSSLDASFKYQLDGPPGSRVLTVEWIGLERFDDPSPDLNFQVKLHEMGRIEFLYGTMYGGTASFSYTIGINGASVSTAPQTSELLCQQGANTTSFGASPQHALSSLPAMDTELTFTPVYNLTPADPLDLTFSSVAPTSMMVRWTDGSTTETYFEVSRSTDGMTFSPVGNVASTSPTQAGGSYSLFQPGLAAGTTYYFRVVAQNEASAASGFLAGSQATTQAGTVTSVASGNWNTPATWNTGSVPTATDKVTIADNHTVTLNASVSCLDLTVGRGGSGILQFDATTARTLTVGRDLWIAPAGMLRSAATGQITNHVLSVGHDLTNDGTLDLSTNGNLAAVVLIFTGPGSATLSGSGPTTDLRTLTVSKTSRPDVVEIRPATLTVRGFTQDASGFLSLVSGTCRIAGSFAAASPVFTSGSYSIGSNAGFWLDNPAFTVSALYGSPTVAGALRVSAGTYNVGTAAGNSLGFASGSVVTIEGGTVAVAGCFGVASETNVVTYAQSGGTVKVNTIGHLSTPVASFDLGISVSSSATMSGGTIILKNASAGASGPRDYRNRVGTSTITGGTLQLGDVVSGPAKTFYLTGDAPGLVVTGSLAGDTAILAANTTVAGTVLIRAGATLRLAGFELALAGGQLINDGSLQGGTPGSRLHFLGSDPQSYSGVGTASPALDGLVIDNPAGVTIDPTITANVQTLRAFLLRGTLSNSQRLTLGDGMTPALTQIGAANQTVPGGSFDGPPSFNVAANGYSVSYLSEAGARTTGFEIPDSRVASSVTIDNPNGVTLSGALQITSALTLANGVLRTSSADGLTLASTVATPPTGSSTSYVEGPLTLEFSAGISADRSFAIGRDGAFRPLRLKGVNTGGMPRSFTAEVLSAPLVGSASPPLSALARARSWRIGNSAELNPSARVVLSIGADDSVGSMFLARVAQASAADGAYATLGGAPDGTPIAGTFESTLDLVPGDDFFAIGFEGAQITWDGGAGTTDWGDSLNWSTDQVPGPGDRIVLRAGAPSTIGVNGAFAVQDLELGDDVAVHVADHVLTVHGAYRQFGGSMDLSTGSLRVLGSTNVMGGRLESGAGLIELGDSCSVSGGLVRLDGSGRLVASGRLAVAGGTLDLGSGTLEILGDFARVSGTFSAGTGTTIFSGQIRQSIGGGATYHALILRNGGPGAPKVLTAGDAYAVEGDFAVEGSTQLALSAAVATTLRVGGDFAYVGLAGGAGLASLTVLLAGNGSIEGGASGAAIASRVAKDFEREDAEIHSLALDWRSSPTLAVVEPAVDGEKPLPILQNTYARRHGEVERLLATTESSRKVVVDLDDRTMVRNAARRGRSGADYADASSELEMNLRVEPGARYVLGGPVSIAGGRTLRVDGRLDCGTFTVGGSGGLFVNAGGALGTAVNDPAGLDATVLAAGPNTYADGAIIEYNAYGDQTIAAAAHPSLALLHTAGSGTKTLDADLSIAGNSGSLLSGAALHVGMGTTFADGGHRLSFTTPFFANVVVMGTFASTDAGAISYEAGAYLSNILASDGTHFGDLLLNFAASVQTIDMNAFSSSTVRVWFRNIAFGGTAGAGEAGGTLRLSETGTTHVTVTRDVRIAPAVPSNTGGGFSGTARVTSNVTLLGHLSSTSTAPLQPILDLAGTNTLIMAGVVPETLSIATSATLLTGATLRIVNASGVVLAGSGRTYTFTGAIELAGGNVTTGTNTLGVAQTGSLIRTSGHVVGTLQRVVATGGSVSQSFEIGSPGRYTPITITFTGVTSSGALAATTAEGDRPDIDSSGLDPSRSVNRSYSLVNAGVLFGSCDATFAFDPRDVDPGADPARFRVERLAGTTWYSTTAGAQTATSTQATGLASFGDFAIGEPLAFADTVLPVVEFVSPNGGQDFRAGDQVDVRWIASDDVGVTRIDLLLSRNGAAGSFETQAVDIPNTGSYLWTVAAAPTQEAFFKVVAHDRAENLGADIADSAFTITAGGAMSGPVILATPADPLVPMIERIDAYFAANEVDGVTRDLRELNNPSEEIRLSVVPQLLGYYDLFRQDRTPAHYEDVVSRADFLVEHFTEATTGTAFDGMLGYALLAAYELTKKQIYLTKATTIMNSCMALSGWNNTLNWGLMAAMGLSKYYAVTGNPAALAKTKEIVNSLTAYQHSDGSFPHYCPGTTDIHYTGWMGMELIIIDRWIDHPPIAGILQGIHSFLAGRVGIDGISQYKDPCPGVPNCWSYYSSRETGCSQDYDTRAWINELGYIAMTLDHYEGPKYYDVMGLLRKLEIDGSFADKWDFMPSPPDPLASWATFTTPSVIRTSVIFWSLTSIYSARGGAALPLVDVPAGKTHGGPSTVWLGPAVPNPMRRSTTAAFELPAAGEVSLMLCDVRGARVRQLVSGVLPAARNAVRWDGRDDHGRPVASGIYFLRLEAERQVRTSKIIVTR